VIGDKLVQFTGLHNDQRQEFDISFCARYGHDDYSLSAINYMQRAYCELPSIQPFIKINNFSLGNVLVLVQNGDYEIEIELEKGLRATGYAHHISSRKKKSYFCLFGINFDSYVLNVFSQNDKVCKHEFDEIRIGCISYPFLAICRRCGQLFTCNCFRDLYSNKDDIVRLLPYGNSEKVLQEYVESIQIANGICSLCTGKVPTEFYGHEMYYSSFLQRYLPYYTLFCRKKYGEYDSIEQKTIENEVRERFGYPKIGESWISETILFKIVKTIFSPLEVIHHYRGNELQGLELDIWIPELRLGIEYQGEQHFQAIEHWGGENGLKKRQENDKKKKNLCKQAGYKLIEFHYSEELSEIVIRKRLDGYMLNKNVIRNF
jgi:hypothetical protein